MQDIDQIAKCYNEFVKVAREQVLECRECDCDVLVDLIYPLFIVTNYKLKFL